MPQQQRNLFDTGPEPWEEDDRAEQLIASVVLLDGPDREFDYSVPDRLREQLQPGSRVQAPLGRGNRLVTGYCVRLESRASTRKLKPIRELIDRRSLLSPAMLRLTGWMADRYLCPWVQVLETVLPSGVRSRAGTRLTTLLSVDPEVAPRLSELRLPEKQAAVIKVLSGCRPGMPPGELARAARCTQGPITALRRKGLIRARTGRVQNHRQDVAPAEREAHLVLNADQQQALDAILRTLNSREHKTVLIHGVTGSGKTEVYIQAIQEVVHFGRQAIVLVPEISLTPQTVERFRSRFGRVAVLHSHLTDAERHWHWQQIAAGSVPVVVGARSAVFAPTPNLGLIVLDEEHESSFKQSTAPRYHARDVAIARAEAEGVPLVLGSATPSLESWRRAREGEYALLEMPRRVLGRPMPEVGTIDLRTAGSYNSRSRGAIGRQMHMAIRQALDDSGQVILLLNRRGFSTHIQCPSCGQAMRCPDCDISLTHHRTDEIALCHYCDYQVPAPSECPKCGFGGISYRGLGTQKLEAEVRRRFPHVSCRRMDTDTMRAHGSHDRVLKAFRAGEVQILLGTQMIAKGLDFPNVTLVGVINADTALHLPDFRAAERTFHLVTQVAGRTGRGDKGGRVLVQTYNPDHAAIRAAVRHDFVAFATGELPMRKLLGYPPFTFMVRLVIRGPVEEKAADFAAQLAERLRAALDEQQIDARVLGPAPAPFSRLRGKYRFQIQAQAVDGERLRQGVRQATADVRPPDEVQWIVDVDPLDML